MVKKKQKAKPLITSLKSSKSKEFTLPVWILDGFVGVLALMIYNFVLYLLKVENVGGFIIQLENAMGYFGLNTFIDFSFGPGTMIIGLILMFALSFIIGIGIGNWVRCKKKYKDRCI